MLYIISSQDIQNSLALRKKNRPEHLKRLEALKEQNRLIIAGPMPVNDGNDLSETGFSGSTVIAEFDSLAEATKWADNDPYMLGGVYLNVSVKPFVKVLPF